MLQKKYRLAKTKDIQAVFARGRSFFCPSFSLKYLSSSQVSPRFTVVVSTKVSKNAVVRNRIKRVVREFLRVKLSKLKKGDYILVSKPQASKVENYQLREALEKLIIESRLLEN